MITPMHHDRHGKTFPVFPERSRHAFAVSLAIDHGRDRCSQRSAGVEPPDAGILDVLTISRTAGNSDPCPSKDRARVAPGRVPGFPGKFPPPDSVTDFRKFLSALAVFFLLLCFPAFAQETPPEPSPVAEVKTKTALDYYKSGGSMMHPILLCSIGTIAVLGYAFLQITRKKMMPMGLHQTLTRHMQNRQVGEAFQLCQDNPNSYTNVVSSALLKVNFDRDLANKVSMEQAIMDSLDEEETKQMLWVNYLNVFATIAPMLGLLGTVGGMILSFDQLAAGKSDPSELAGGIGVAMITTAGGLLVGIPAMFFYFFFRNRVMGIMTSIQKNATFLIDVLSGEVRLAGEGAPGGESHPVEAEESRPE